MNMIVMTTIHILTNVLLVCVRLFASADPNVLLPIGLLLGGATFLFILSVATYRLFEVDVVLWFRGAFPLLYANKGGRGPAAAVAAAAPVSCVCAAIVSQLQQLLFALRPQRPTSVKNESRARIEKKSTVCRIPGGLLSNLTTCHR